MNDNEKKITSRESFLVLSSPHELIYNNKSPVLVIHKHMHLSRCCKNFPASLPGASFRGKARSLQTPKDLISIFSL